MVMFLIAELFLWFDPDSNPESEVNHEMNIPLTTIHFLIWVVGVALESASFSLSTVPHVAIVTQTRRMIPVFHLLKLSGVGPVLNRLSSFENHFWKINQSDFSSKTTKRMKNNMYCKIKTNCFKIMKTNWCEWSWPFLWILIGRAQRPNQFLSTFGWLQWALRSLLK